MKNFNTLIDSNIPPEIKRLFIAGGILLSIVSSMDYARETKIEKSLSAILQKKLPINFAEGEDFYRLQADISQKSNRLTVIIKKDTQISTERIIYFMKEKGYRIVENNEIDDPQRSDIKSILVLEK